MQPRNLYLSGVLVGLIAAGGLAFYGFCHAREDPLARYPRLLLYGKLIDQQGMAIDGADVAFQATAMVMVGPPFYDGNERHWRVFATTAADGTFTIDGGRGDSLSGGSFHKIGYADGSGGDRPAFSDEPDLAPPHSSAEHPSVFGLWNLKYRHILSRTVHAEIDDDSYLVEYASGRVRRRHSSAGGFEFRVIATPAHTPPFDWTVDVGSSDITVAECKGSLGDTAPTDGYVPKLTFTVKAEDPDWSRSRTFRFYTRRAWMGHATYGAVDLTVDLGGRGEKNKATIAYTVSCDNSPDLRPGPALAKAP